MAPKAIPDRWLAYKACGDIIEGTRIICFKVPLRKVVQEKEPSLTEIWDIPSLLARIPKLSAVIDLTNTDRYYDPNDFRKANVLHKKILMPGRVLPPESKVKEFMDTVDEFLGADCDSLVGVHCTHGLNRTGYMVCRYMKDRLGIPGPEALNRFEIARGYKVERPVYTNDIIKTESISQIKGKKPRNERNKPRNKHSEIIGETQSEQSSVLSYGGQGFHKQPPLLPTFNSRGPNKTLNFQRNSDEGFGNSTYHSGQEFGRPSNNYRDHNNFSAPRSFRDPNNYSGSNNLKGPTSYSGPSNRCAPYNYSGPNNRGSSSDRGPRHRGGLNNYSGPNNFKGPNNYSDPNNFRGPPSYSSSSNRGGRNYYSELRNRSVRHNYSGPSNYSGSNNISGSNNFRGTNERHYSERNSDSGSKYKNDGKSNHGQSFENNWRSTRNNQSTTQHTWRNSNYGERRPRTNLNHLRFDDSNDC